MPDTHVSATVAASHQDSTRLPVEIAKAIGEVMAKIMSIPKGERNEHDNYNFASIDDFLAFIGPLCSTAGLIILQDQESAELLDRSGKGWLKITYSFTLAHISGVVSDRPIRRTVLHQVRGPQTTGSSQSYALKQFLRSLFQVPTGDYDDADYQAKTDMPAADTQARQKPQDHPDRQQRLTPQPKASQATQRLPVGPGGRPPHVRIEQGRDGLLIGRWVSTAKELLNGKQEAWRREWLQIHKAEIEEVRRARREWADRLEGIAVTPDLAPLADAAE